MKRFYKLGNLLLGLDLFLTCTYYMERLLIPSDDIVSLKERFKKTRRQWPGSVTTFW